MSHTRTRHEWLSISFAVVRGAAAKGSGFISQAY